MNSPHIPSPASISPTNPAAAIPTGPRSRGTVPIHSQSSGGWPARPVVNNNSSSGTYPRTQRFGPPIVPGGKQLPVQMDSKVVERLAKLEADKQRLEKELMEKEAKKRQALREWETMEREATRESLKVEMADAQLMGDEDFGSAF
jgi:hypothetical protein